MYILYAAYTRQGMYVLSHNCRLPPQVSVQQEDANLGHLSGSCLTYCITHSIVHYTMNDRAQLALDSLLSEIRRGSIVLAVLACLKQEQYGYSLKRSLGEAGIEVDEGTLYPLLRRLEGQGLLDSRWALEEQRPRRYYRINATGQEVLRGLSREWKALAANIGGLL